MTGDYIRGESIVVRFDHIGDWGGSTLTKFKRVVALDETEEDEVVAYALALLGEKLDRLATKPGAARSVAPKGGVK